MKLDAPEGYKFYVQHSHGEQYGGPANFAEISLWKTADNSATSRVQREYVLIDGLNEDQIIDAVTLRAKHMVRVETYSQSLKAVIERNFNDE